MLHDTGRRGSPVLGDGLGLGRASECGGATLGGGGLDESFLDGQARGSQTKCIWTSAAKGSHGSYSVVIVSGSVPPHSTNLTHPAVSTLISYLATIGVVGALKIKGKKKCLQYANKK